MTNTFGEHDTPNRRKCDKLGKKIIEKGQMI